MKCATASCSNEARYINERGELCCGLCPIKEGIDSIQIAAVPALLALARQITDQMGLNQLWCGSERAREFLKVIGYRPT